MSRYLRMLGIMLLGAMLLTVMSACGGGGGSTSLGSGGGVGGGGGGVGAGTFTGFAVVADPSANNVPVLGIPSSGALATVAGSPFIAGASPSRVAVAPNGRWVYVANLGNVSQFSISTAGALTPLDPAVNPATQGVPGAIAVDPSGHFVLVANQAARTLSAFAINQATGALPATATTVTNLNVNPVSIAMKGTFLYLAGGGNSLDGYTLNTTSGVLTPMAGTPFLASNLPSALNSLAVSPAGLFLYAANTTTAQIHVFTLNATTGVPTQQGSGTVSSSDPTNIVINPTGTLLFAANPANNKITTFFVNPTTGSFTSTLPTTTTLTAPSSLAYDATNNFLLVLHGTNNMSVFAVNQTTGALTAVTGSPFTVGSAPSALAVAKP